MKIDDSSKLFKQFIKYKNKKLADLLPCDGVELFKEFYRDYRFEDAQTDKGDGLACYYGLSRDGGLKFEVGMVRVFRIIDQPHAGANRRLRLSFVYPFVETIVHTGLDKVKGSPEGNKFCWTPDEQIELDTFIQSSELMQAVINKPSKAVKLKFENLWGVF